MDLNEVAEALAAAARVCTYPGPELGDPPRQLMTGGFAPEKIDPPCLEVGEVELGDDLTFDDDNVGAVESATFTLRIYVARGGAADVAHPLLRLFLGSRGPSSIKQALEADRTLGGLVDALLVTRRYGYGLYEVAANNYYGARIDVRVWGRG